MFLKISFTTLLIVILLGGSRASRHKALRGNSQTSESSSTIFSKRDKPDRDSSSRGNICPVPQGHEDKCDIHDDHVICSYRGMDCEYQNMCDAKSSDGIVAVNCKLKVTSQTQQEQTPLSGSIMFDPNCPSTNDGTPCPAVMDTVVCDVNGRQCPYNNICKAKATIGIDSSKCESKQVTIIPLPDPNKNGTSMTPIPSLMNPEGCPSDTNGTFCPQVMDPYVCNVNELKCTYGNSCKAKATIGIDPSKCERGVSMIPLPNPIQGGGSMTPIPILMNPEGCPSDMNGTFCPEVMDPYVCNVNELKCTYGNSCKANMTIGVDSTKCTKVTKNEIDIKLNETKSDPKQVFDSCQGLPMKFHCTREYSPLVCEYKDTVCKFTNLCIAYSILGEQGSGKCRSIEQNVFLG